jgi:tetratricopeptide (TPR) repeat protein
VLYHQLEPSVRGLLHRRAVRTLRRLHGGRQEEHAAEIGHHLARSPGLEEQRHGARLLVAAGLAHFDSEAYADAVGPYREALAIIDQALANRAALSAADRAELEAARLDAWERLARIGIYYDHVLAEDFLTRLYRHHRDAAGLSGDGDAERQARRASGRPPLQGAAAAVRSGLQRGRLLAGALGRYARTALAAQSDRQRAALQPLERFFLTTTYRATLLADLGRLNDALDLAEELRPLVLSPRRVEAGAYQLSRVTALIHQGRFGLAMQACEAADTGLAEQRAGIDPYDRAMGEAGVLFSRAVTLAFRGHPAWQAEHARLLAAADRFDLEFARMTARVVMTVASAVRGDRHTAHETLQAYLAHYRTLGRAAHAYRVYPWMALVELEAGQLAAARAHLETFRQGAPAGYFGDGMGAYLEGELLLAAGDPAGAVAPLERALTWARHPSTESLFLGSRARLGLGEAALALGRPDQAVAHAEAVLAAAGAAPSRCERDHVRARRLLGRGRLATGDAASARPELGAALVLCHAVDSPLECALTHAAHAALAAETADWSGEAAHRREAERHFQALGNDVAARRLRRRPAGTGMAPDAAAATGPDRAGDADPQGGVTPGDVTPSDVTRADRPVRRRH